MDSYGSDIELDSGGDVVFTDDGELSVITGGVLVAQDVRTELMLSPGSCFWAPEFGKGLEDALKGPNDIDVEGALRAAAFNDERINFDSISTSQLEGGRYQLSFKLIDGVEPVVLLFDLDVR